MIKEISDDKLFLKSEYIEILQSGYDKLSAHKVFSLEIKLIVPENLKIEIESNIASVTAIGEFEYLQIQLKQGNCEVLNFSGNALVNTFTGNIFFQIEKNK